MLIGAETLFSYAMQYRYIWFSNHFGSGKTSLAYRLAYGLYVDRSNLFRYILSNCQDVFSSPLSSVELRENSYIDAVIILDEGGQHIDRNSAKDFVAYLRKQNCVILIPSFQPPPVIMRGVQVARIFDFSIVGLDLSIYKCMLDFATVRETFLFYWWYTSEMHGTYLTLDYSAEDGCMAILEFLNDRSSYLASLSADATSSLYSFVRLSAKRKKYRKEQSYQDDFANSAEELADRLSAYSERKR